MRPKAYLIEVALFERRGNPKAADALRAPFVLGDRAGLAKRFREADAVSIDFATHDGRARYPSIAP